MKSHKNKEQTSYDEALKRMREPYISIFSEFDRQGKSMHALYKAKEKYKIVVTKESIISLSKAECLNMVEALIKKHHTQTQGDLGILGKVRFYYYRHCDGNIFGFDKYGEPL